MTAAADAAPALAPDVRDAGVDAAPQPQIVRASIGPADGSSASASTATADLGGLTGGASTAAAAAAVTTPAAAVTASAAAVTIPAAALAAVTSPADAFAELQRHKTDHEKVCGIMSALIAADRLWLGDAEHASIIARAMVIHRTHAGVVKLATTIIKRLAREPDAIPAVATRQVIQCLLVALPLHPVAGETLVAIVESDVARSALASDKEALHELVAALRRSDTQHGKRVLRQTLETFATTHRKEVNAALTRFVGVRDSMAVAAGLLHRILGELTGGASTVAAAAAATAPAAALAPAVHGGATPSAAVTTSSAAVTTQVAVIL